MNEPRIDDRGIEIMVSNILRAGVIIAAVVVIFGGMIYLPRHGGETPDYKVFKTPPASDRLVPDIVSAALQHRARSIIQLGILLLIATPISRVAFSMIGFALERDRKYVVITAIVLSILLYSLISGARGV